jgi:hypothetical protein
MSLIGDKLIRLFGGDDVYLGKVEATEVPKPKEKKKSSIIESIGNVLNIVFLNANPFQVLSRRKLEREEEELQRKQRKMDTINRIKKSRDTYNTRNESYDKMIKEKWNDSIDRPGIEVGREYLKNIKIGLAKGSARPEQITETLFRDTFRKKNFSENDITTLWGEYSFWARQYKSNGRITY